MRPPWLPPAERFAHGTRSRYTSGCRCAPCRAANTAYQRARTKAKIYGRANPLRPVAAVVRHLRSLARAGVGVRPISDAAKVAGSTIRKVLAGQRLHLREATARRLLAVTADVIADGALVPAGPTWKLLDELIDEGFTRTDLARRLGSKGRRPTLQIRRDRVEAATAAKVERLHRQLTT